MATVSATGTGNWSAVVTGYTAADTIEAAGYTVALDQDVTVAGLTNNGGGGFSVADMVMVAFGDSITAGSGATETSKQWANLVASACHFSLQNSGIGGTMLQNSISDTNNGRDTYAARVLAYAPNYVAVLYGLNDLRHSNASVTVANYQNDLSEIIAALIAGGILANRIVIGSPPYMKPSFYASYAPYDGGNSTIHAAYVAAASGVADAYDTCYADVYTAMLNNGGDTLVSYDGVHPNDAGHAVIANAFLMA